MTTPIGKWVEGIPSSSQWTVAGMSQGRLVWRSRNGVLWTKRGEQWFRWKLAKHTNTASTTREGQHG